MKRFEDAIHELAGIRATQIEAALMKVYEKGAPYWSDDRLELFRADMPTERDMEQHTASVLSKHAGITDPLVISLFCESYANYGYHCLVHGVLTAIIVRRLSDIYLPHHPDMARIAVLAAMFHDSFHTHGAMPDTDNITRAQRYVRHVIAIHGERLDLPKNAAQTMCEIIRITEWTLGAFPYAIPVTGTTPLPDTASANEQQHMAMRIVAEADLMMSATPLWPALGSVVAHDMSTTANNDVNLDIEQFCCSQIHFIKRTCMQRLQLAETQAAAQAVADLHQIIMDMNT